MNYQVELAIAAAIKIYRAANKAYEGATSSHHAEEWLAAR